MPPIALTCGEPAGIGPELAPLARKALGTDVPFFWIGDPRHLPAGTDFTLINSPADCTLVPSQSLPVLQHSFPEPQVPGLIVPANAQSVIDVIRHAVDLVQGGDACAVCTGPINKEALKTGANFQFPGHTEFLSHLAGGADVVMMLAGAGLRVVPVTIHLPIAQVPARLTAELLEKTIRITDAALRRDFGIFRPRFAVAGLNPHAGEGGTIGSEEVDFIAPLVKRLRNEGLDLQGPFSADTMFHARARAGYDVAICMYHDQALIPIKTLDFDGSVNVTLGLPFVRTSPDHGTALDIAGKGLARPDSLIAALRYAHQMARTRRGIH